MNRLLTAIEVGGRDGAWNCFAARESSLPRTPGVSGCWSLTVPAALSVFFPHWPIDLLLRRERRAEAGRGEVLAASFIFFVQTSGQQQLVAACCDRSIAAGVRVGMTLAHARALVPVSASSGLPPLRIEPFTPQSDLAALEALARWCTRLAPVVAADPPDGLLMDLSGCERYYRGRAAIVRQVARAMMRLGFRARMALAPTFGCAWAMARFAGDRTAALAGLLVPDGQQRCALEPLPVRALRIDAAAQLALREVAIDRIGDLLRLPRASLAPRFGQHLLLRIDQALGDAIEVLTPVRPPEPINAEILFDGPTTRVEAIEMAARQVLDDLAARLVSRGRGARRVDVSLTRSDLPPLVIELATSRPTHNPRHLWKLLRPRLERAQLGFGVEAVGARALRLARMRDQQADWLKNSEASDTHDEPAAELIDTLAARLGQDRVLRVELLESHTPERLTRLVTAMQPPPRPTPARPRAGAIDAPRPCILLDRPEPAEVIALWPEGPPTWLRWRGREMKLVHAAGPERITPEWWRRADGVDAARCLRDYYRVTAEDGSCLWVFRREPQRTWFVHGVW